MKTQTKMPIFFRLAVLGFIVANSVNIIMAQSSQNTATVYILRETALGIKDPYGAAKFPITVNEIQLGTIKAKKYFECLVPTGIVSISTVTASKRKERDDLTFRVEGGRKYYVMVNIESEVIGTAASGGSGFSVGKISFGNTKNVNNSSYPIYDHSASLARMGDAQGNKLLGKFKLQEFVDLSDNDAPASLTDKEDYLAAAQGVEDTKTTVQPRNSDVDVNIPITDKTSPNTFVLIIANENYEFVDDVQFALNDGEAVKEYCIKTLGVPERQVWFYKDASLGLIAGGIEKMVQAMNIFDNAKAIVYYCGHGIPDEKTGDAYLVPTDGKGTNVATCYSLNQLYKTLSDSKAKSVTYFMDACFTGANRDGSMLVAARGVAREAKKETIEGNTVVFSAASGDETAMPYTEKQHGLFTYFLLKKIQETKGDVSYGELADYIKTNVRKEAFLANEKPQNPIIATGTQMGDSWKTNKLK
ncbi:MAG: caspase family protein [Bacteroidales bacterium]|nr:caspase family protein [Bacteroidales bacterium]